MAAYGFDGFGDFFGTSFMPQMGQFPGAFLMISGCIGQV
jgi:hypothetical protein